MAIASQFGNQGMHCRRAGKAGKAGLAFPHEMDYGNPVITARGLRSPIGCEGHNGTNGIRREYGE